MVHRSQRRPRSRRGGWLALIAAVCLGVTVPHRRSPASTAAAADPVQFSNVTVKAGVHFVHFKGANGTSTILEEAGPGVCVADYDGDGYQDIYFVNGRDLYHRAIAARNALYHNNGDGTFTDVTDRAGVPGSAYGLGCVWGDYDNDGFPDLFVTQYGRNLLYHNNGDGTFIDVTDKAGVGATELGTTFHTAAAFFDYDRDGLLDLYAGGYANFLPDSKRNCDIGGGILSSCRPSVYPGSPDVLYHNNGDGTFKEVTRAARIYQPNGYNLAVAAADYDDDGWPDLFVANDGTDAYLYHNNHDGTFANVAVSSGMAYTEQGNAMAGMCIGLGDYDNDGRLDLLITDFQMMSDHLWHNAGKGYFDEVSDRAGIAGPTRRVLSFGGGFFDYDNDGWVDLFIANGSVYPEITRVSPDLHYKQINSLFHNDRNGRFTEVGAASGGGFKIPYAGRGVAFADFDNDGYVDVVVANNGDPPLLLHNEGSRQSRNHFVNFRLVGTRSNRDGMGARVRLRAGALRQIREISGAGSYMSQSDLRAEFGLGTSRVAEEVEIRWPSGARQVLRNVPADRFYTVVEGTPGLRPQKGSRSAKVTAGAGPIRRSQSNVGQRD